MAVTRGKDFRMYYNSGTTTPTWVEVSNCRDLTRNLETALADASTRGSSYRQQVGTIKDLTIDFQMIHDPTDDVREMFEDAFHTNADVEIVVLDGSIDTIGSKGLRTVTQVTKYTGNEALEDVGLDDVTLVPSYAPTNPPRRVEVTTPGDVADVA